MSETAILIVEDEEKLSELLRSTLSSQFDVVTCPTYSEFETLLDLPTVGFEVVILDRMLGSHDSIQLLPRFKQKFPQCRVLILSAINTPVEKAFALESGADDYLSKPFAWEELLARVRTLARRSPRELRFGNIAIDTLERRALVAENEVPLSNKEFLLLRAFIQKPGRVFSKQVLFEDVWNLSSEIESNSIETTMTKLRRKLEEAGASASIRNSRNLGYWLEE